MKFLDSKEISEEKGNVKVVFKPITSIHQSALLRFQVNLAKAIEAKDVGLNVHIQMQAVVYALESMINELIVGGESYKPLEVATMADPSDPDTFETLKTIYSMLENILVQGDTKKKSSTPRKSTKQG
jgi:hypothetical protein